MSSISEQDIFPPLPFNSICFYCICEILHFIIHKLCHILHLLARTKPWSTERKVSYPDRTVCFCPGHRGRVEVAQGEHGQLLIPIAASRPSQHSLLLILLTTATQVSTARQKQWAKPSHYQQPHFKNNYFNGGTRGWSCRLKFFFFFLKKLQS